ncbi:DNA polymerase III subunit gamma and tau [Actinomadura sp. DC4]|uniref:DNA polymerase III subunit gamma and tau n=1 Tax=Actinomadura sp. DC4 TaxID=3055069 RepID=UPI0025B01261|nr:DNA polymerase III subunit gamma and tau [Actinomadura sp. DC4]MDN3354482.1 DNA polymerase III subunit gamma and tau [Actinomadura sp. DC4]
MSLALYRKYRPATFAELKGQEHVAEPLQQALRNGRINHAYLFSGPRGCGKTSSARILARSLNCENGPTPEPCGKCDSCVALGPTGSGHIDVIEIDAASHGGVDDARDLRERAFFAPVAARFKIYIIDEAHMVTREGFNALLKLVEEPPSHLKFIFATTEPEKVIGTIRSRTHHYPFRLIPPGTLRELLEDILQKEDVPYEPAAIPLVVRAGAGSARDSESILDQLLAGSGEDGITYARAVSLLGYTDATLLDEVVDAVAAHDGGAVFASIDRVMEGGQDPRRFAADLLERFRDLVILSNVPDAGANGLLDVPSDELERMQAQASRLGPAELTRAADLLHTGLTEMRGATAPRLLLELICARILLPGAYDDESSLLARLDRLERRFAIGDGAPASEMPPIRRPQQAANNSPAQTPRADQQRDENQPPPVSRESGPPPARGGDPTSIVQPGQRRGEDERAVVDNSAAGSGTGGSSGGGAGSRGSGSRGGGSRGSGSQGAGSRGSATGGGSAGPGYGPTDPDEYGSSEYGPGGNGAGGNGPGGSGAEDRARSNPAAASRTSGGQPPADDIGWPTALAPGGRTQPQRPNGARSSDARSNDGRPNDGRPNDGRPNDGRPNDTRSNDAHSGDERSEASAGTAKSGSVDVSAIRGMWVDILEAVKQRSKVAWIVLMEGVDVASLEGNVLTLAFANEGKRRGFTTGGKEVVLREALKEILGVDWRIDAVLDNGQGGRPSSPPPPPPEPGGWGNTAAPPRPRETRETSNNTRETSEQSRPPQASGIVPPPPEPMDEADEVDPEGDADAGNEAALTGMALIEQVLGGKVIQEIDNA